MTHTVMLKKLIEAGEGMREAQKKYENHPGGGVSQVMKNRLRREYESRRQQFDNTIFNIKQFLK
jgi:hypothetical protein